MSRVQAKKPTKGNEGAKGYLHNSEINERWARVYTYQGIGIYVLKEAYPEKGDPLGYLVDLFNYQGRYYDTIQSSIDDIDLKG